MKNTKTLQIIFESVLCSTVFIVLLGVTTNLLYTKSIQALEDQIKMGLVSTISASATTLSGAQHTTFDRDTVASDPNYQLAAQHMEGIRQAASDIRYIYTCILDQGKVYFMVNPSPQNDTDGDGVPDTPPALMTPYDDAPAELKIALQEQATAVSSEPYKDQWGSFISAYAPFYDNHGHFIGVLAMDLELSNFYERLASIERVFSKAKIIIFFLGLIVGLTIWWIRRSHVNHLVVNLSKEADNVERLAQASSLNTTLSSLNSHFYLQGSQTESVNAQEDAKLAALYQYAQSLKSMTLELTKQPIQTWFQALDNSVQARCNGHHQWHISLEIEVLLSCDALAEELISFHQQLSDKQHASLTADTILTEELLGGWQLTTTYLLSSNSEKTTPEKSDIKQYFNNGNNSTECPTLITEYTVPEINLVTTINRLRLMGCQFLVHENSQIDMQWTIFKEKAE